VVLTLWDWSRPTAYLHDDRDRPGAIAHRCHLRQVLRVAEESRITCDPRSVTIRRPSENLPVRDEDAVVQGRPMRPLPYWGAEPIWIANQQSQPDDGRKGTGLVHHPRVRPPANPDFCKKGSDPSVGKGVPLENANGICPCTILTTVVSPHQHVFPHPSPDLCRGRTTRCGPALAARTAVGWSTARCSRTRRRGEVTRLDALILDTNGNGKRDGMSSPIKRSEPTKDKAGRGALYSVA